MMMKKKQPHIASHIPHHVMELILSRLPAKSLLRFMAVCKLWRSTICDINFTELHRRHSQNRIGGSYFAFVGFGKDKAIVRFNNHGKYEVPPPIELKLSPFLQHYYRVSISPILNGLVCLYSDGKHPHSLIMNITTREILPLPKSRYRGISVRSTLAIGFDPATNKYIVLHYGKWFYKDPISEVFTLGTTSWRYCANTPNLIMEFSKTSRCLNGRIYWLTFDGDDRFLISFDVSREVYHTAKLSLPLDHHLSNLFTLGGDLAAVRFCGKKEGIDVLKIERFNNELKAVRKRKIAFPSWFKYIGELLVLGVSPNGEIVLKDECMVDITYYLDLDDSEGAWEVEFDSRKTSGIVTYNAENMLRLSGPSLASRQFD